MKVFKLNSTYIELCQLLKLEGPFQSGGEIKHKILSGLVSVDGQREFRKKCKIRAGQRVKYQDFEVTVVSALED